MPNPTLEVSKRIRMAMIGADRKRADLRTALAATTRDGEPMSDSAVGRRLDGDLPWNVLELVAVARFLQVPLSTLIPDTLTETTP